MKHKYLMLGCMMSVMTFAGFTTNQSHAQNEVSQGIDNQLLVELKLPDIKLPHGNKPLECRLFRIRILDIKPGKEVGVHSHENRPGALSIAGGTGMKVYAYNYDPVDVMLGGSYKAYNDIVHYAANLSETKPLSIMTTDLLDDGSECNGKKYPQYTPILDGLKTEKNPFFATAPQTAEENETNHEYFRTPVSDIKIPEGKTPLAQRSLRVRKVTLEPGASIDQQDYANRPSYIMNLEGVTEVNVQDSGEIVRLKPKEAVSLINVGQVLIQNPGDKPASYFVIELWDPKDEGLI